MNLKNEEVPELKAFRKWVDSFDNLEELLAQYIAHRWNMVPFTEMDGAKMWHIINHIHHKIAKEKNEKKT